VIMMIIPGIANIRSKEQQIPFVPWVKRKKAEPFKTPLFSAIYL